MGSLRSLRRQSGSDEDLRPSSVNRPDPIQLGMDLVSACWSRDWQSAESLLHMGADPNFVDPASPTSSILGLALECKAKIDVIKLLLKKGADVIRVPEALLGTCHKHQVKKTELLLKHGADPNVKDAQGLTPLMISLFGNWDRFIRPLVKYGADLNAVDNHGRTALIIAAKLNNIGAVRELLRCGADPYLKDNDGRTAMELGRKWWLVVEAFEAAGIAIPENE